MRISHPVDNKTLLGIARGDLSEEQWLALKHKLIPTKQFVVLLDIQGHYKVLNGLNNGKKTILPSGATAF